jgi:alpha-tubulin suppressor-like RCC1 family protein
LNYGSNEIPKGKKVQFDSVYDTYQIVQAAASGHTCALLTNGQILCWGNNSSGQVGSLVAGAAVGGGAGDMVNLMHVPFDLAVVEENIAVQVTTGNLFTCALFTNGGIICWGNGAYGVLGTDSTTNVADTTTLNFLSFSDTLPAISLASGQSHSCAIFATQRVRCWGKNMAEQLGDKSTLDRGSGTGSYSLSSALFVSFSASINSVPIVDVSLGE